MGKTAIVGHQVASDLGICVPFDSPSTTKRGELVEVPRGWLPMPTSANPDSSYCEYPAWRCAVSAWSLLDEGFGAPALVSCLFASEVDLGSTRPRFRPWARFMLFP